MLQLIQNDGSLKYYSCRCCKVDEKLLQTQSLSQECLWVKFSNWARPSVKMAFTQHDLIFWLFYSLQLQGVFQDCRRLWQWCLGARGIGWPCERYPRALNKRTVRNAMVSCSLSARMPDSFVQLPSSTCTQLAYFHHLEKFTNTKDLKLPYPDAFIPSISVSPSWLQKCCTQAIIHF